MASINSSNKKEWTQKQVSELISQYESFQCLWNVNAKEYRDRNQKEDALNVLSITFDTTVAEITRKLHNIRSQYNNERRKILEKKSSQDGSNWSFYNALQFLQGSIGNKPRLPAAAAAAAPMVTKGYFSQEIHKSAGATPAGPSSSSSSSSSSASVKRKHSNNNYRLELSDEEEEEEKLLKEEADPRMTSTKPNDEYAVFGKFVGNEVRGLRSEHLRRKAKRRIQQVILEIGQQDDLYGESNSNSGENYHYA